ncbi:TPA: hypothetical protein ACKQE3_000179 [Serratia marcescens]|uniref:hypothetical protein n=1 Tax=Serratia bockelmannii TaxID=2703793 RepID=UPI0038C6016A
MSKVLPPNITVDIDNPELLAFCNSLSTTNTPQSIKVIDNPRPIGYCYWNAWAHQKENGGKVVHGWVFNEWPGYFIIAMHHAVWQSEDGELYDVSEKYDTDKIKERTTFLMDDSIEINLHKLPKVCSHFHTYSNITPVLRRIVDFIIHSYQTMNFFEQRGSEMAYHSGYRCENQFNTAERKTFTPKEPYAPNELFALEWKYYADMENIYRHAFTASLQHLDDVTKFIK